MKPTNRKEISDALIKAMQKEELHTREAAKYLNLNPCYISMAQNQNSWDSMGKAAWIRLEEWFNSNSTISMFEIPAGEEIWIPRPRPEKIELVSKSKEKESAERPGLPVYKDTPLPPKKRKENQDSLKDENYLFIKKKEAEFMDFISREIEKRIQSIHGPSALPQSISDTAKMKVALDIEINLVINGQKVRLN